MTNLNNAGMTIICNTIINIYNMFHANFTEVLLKFTASFKIYALLYVLFYIYFIGLWEYTI